MDLTAASTLDTDPDLAPMGAEDGLANGSCRGPSNEARNHALDASGPLWPLALNGWMPLDRLPDRLANILRARADAPAVPAPCSGAAS